MQFKFVKCLSNCLIDSFPVIETVMQHYSSTSNTLYNVVININTGIWTILRSFGMQILKLIREVKVLGKMVVGKLIEVFNKVLIFSI